VVSNQAANGGTPETSILLDANERPDDHWAQIYAKTTEPNAAK